VLCKKTRKPTHGKEAARVVTGFSFVYSRSGVLAACLAFCFLPAQPSVYVLRLVFPYSDVTAGCHPGFVSFLTFATQIPLLQGLLQFKP